MKNTLDINCDMGESFGAWRICSMSDDDLLKGISSANVAAGFHAGDPNHINTLVRLSKKYNVNVGAHIGYQDLQGFGRRRINASIEELVNDMVYQIGAVREFCKLHGVPLTHIKPHGALYMELAVNTELSTLFVEALKKIAPQTPLFCMGNTQIYYQGKKQGVHVVREFFVDRDYDDNGFIVFVRAGEGANTEKIKKKLVLALTEQKVETITGNIIDLPFESVSFHSDTPSCDVMVRCVTEVFEQYGVKRIPYEKINF